MKARVPSLESRINIERRRRLRLKREGRPYVYRTIRDGEQKHADDVWCDYCAGWFGVAHSQHDEGLCRSLSRALSGERQCACIDCVVAARESR